MKKLWLLCLLSVSAYGQTATITGTVTDNNGITASYSATVTATTGTVAPKPADTVADAVGIVDHMEIVNAGSAPPTFVYGINLGACGISGQDCYDTIIQPWLASSGIRHVRAPCCLPASTRSGPIVQHRLDEAVAIPTDLVAVVEHGFVQANVDNGYTAANHGFVAYEGDNEPDLASETCAQIIANQTTLWNTLKADPLLSGLQIWGPSLTVYTDTGWRASGCAPLNTIADAGNHHTYMPGGLPLNPEATGSQAGGAPGNTTSVMGYYLSHCQGIYAGAPPYSGSPPCHITELGMRTCQPGEVNKSLNSIQCVSEAIMARYVPRWVIYNLNVCNTEAPTSCGWGKQFFHQIADNHGPALNPTTGRYDPQSGYGIAFHWDGAPKPAGTALKSLVALFGDTTPFTPTPLTLSISRATSDVQHMLYQRSNGQYMLPIWRGLPGWDTDSTGAYQTITVPPETVSVQLPATVASVNVTTFQDDGTTSAGFVSCTAGNCPITVTDHLQVLQF